MFIETTQIIGVFIAMIAALAAGAVSFIISGMAAKSDYLPDRPNGRSSHRRVTPRSGGLAIMGGWLVAMVIIAILVRASAVSAQFFTLAAFGAGVVLVGFIDDRFSLTPKIKLTIQIICAAAFAWACGSLAIAPLPFLGATPLGIFSMALTVFWIVAFMNAYNFMDGAHGIAASAGIIVLSALALVAGVAGAMIIAVAALMLAVALGGFLPVNFPKGRIFMGDNGSQSVSFLIAGLAVMAANQTNGAVSALFVPTAMMVFLFDVSFTLCHRLMRGQNILSAHREHLYQLLLRRGRSHIFVTGLYAALTALATAVAVLMLRLPPAWHWIAPAGLALLLALPTIRIYRKCKKDGFFAEAENPSSGFSEEFLGDLDHPPQAAAQ